MFVQLIEDHIKSGDKSASKNSARKAGTHDQSVAFIVEASKLKISALRALGRKQISANGRNYYLSEAGETQTAATRAVNFWHDKKQSSAKIVNALSAPQPKSTPLGLFFEMLPLRLDAEKCQLEKADFCVVFRVRDTNEVGRVPDDCSDVKSDQRENQQVFSIHLRNGVADIQVSCY